MLWMIYCFMWKRSRPLFLILPLISLFFFPVFKYQIISSLFKFLRDWRHLQSWNLVSRLMYYMNLNQAASAYLFLYFFNCLSLKFQNIKFFATLFWEAYKVETWYTHGQWVDLLHTPNTSSQNILVPLFFFFILSLQLAKIKNLHRSTKLFQHTSDGYGWGRIELCSLSAIFVCVCVFVCFFVCVCV